GDHTWLNVSDGRNAIGVWVEAKDMQGVDTPGRYNMRGDTVRVTGVFHRACADHGGDFDIHANKMDVTQKGYAVTHQTETVKAVFAFILLAGAAVCLVLVLKTKSRNGGNNGPF
ncbi:MAG: DNA-binding protein, partial [Bacillota bacterium]